MDDAVIIGSGPERARGRDRARAGGRLGARARGRATRSAAACAPPSSRFPASRTTSAPAVTRWACCRRSSASCRSQSTGCAGSTRRASVAHPLDDEPAVLLRPLAAARRRASSGEDARAYETLFAPFLRDPHGLLADLLGAAAAFPRTRSRCPASGCPACFRRRSRSAPRFRDKRARALFAGCAAHSILPLERPLTAAVGMIFAITAHVEDWPVAAGGSQAIAQRARLVPQVARRRDRDRHGSCDRSRIFPPRASCSSTPARRSSPTSAGDACRRATSAGSAAIATGPACSSSTGRSTGRSRGATRVCLEASTVHVGGTLDEIARRRARHVARRAPRAAVRPDRAAEPVRSDARARGQAHRLCLLPRSARLDRRHDRRDRAADRALRARASATASSPATRCTRPISQHDNPNYRGRRDHRRRRRPLPVLHPAGHPARSLLDPEPAPLHLLGGDAARRRRPRHVRLLRGAERAAEARPPTGESCGDCCRVKALR